MRRPIPGSQSTGRFSRLRRSPWVRYGAAGVILLAVAAYHFVPTVISPSSARSALEDALTGWLGAPASVTGDAKLTYWPRPKVTAVGTAVPRPDGSGLLIYGNAAKLTADYGLIGALSGQPEFSDIKLENAVIVLEDTGTGNAPPSNRLATAIAAARDGKSETLRGDGPGELQLVNSTIALTGNGDTRIVKAVNGELDWARMEGAARFNGTAAFGEEAAQISIDVSNPTTLLAGGTSQIDLGVTSPVTSVNYQGMASSRKPYFLNGSFALSTTDMQGFLNRLGVETRLLSTIKQASLKGQVERSDGSLRFSPVELAIGGSKGTGALDIVMQTDDAPARISATMAFGDIALFDAEATLPSWIDTMASSAAPDGGPPLSDLDLRVSAGTVRLSDISLADVAASIIRTDEQTSFDIADSRLDNGTLYAHVAVRNENDASVRLTAEKVKSAPLFRQLGVAVPLESDALNLELTYKASLPLEKNSKDNLSGNFRFSANGGQLNWLDLNAILETARNSNAFAFSPLKQSPYAFQSIKGRGTLDGTTLSLDDVTIETAGETVTIEGKVDTATGQLQANLTSMPKTDTTQPVSLEINGNALAAFARVTRPETSLETE